jgi:hypothetical protein
VIHNLAVVAGLPAVINTMQPPTASAVAAPHRQVNHSTTPARRTARSRLQYLATEDRMALWDMATGSGRYGPFHEWTAQAGEHRRAAATANGDRYEG